MILSAPLTPPLPVSLLKMIAHPLNLTLQHPTVSLFLIFILLDVEECSDSLPANAEVPSTSPANSSLSSDKRMSTGNLQADQELSSRAGTSVSTGESSYCLASCFFMSCHVCHIISYRHVILHHVKSYHIHIQLSYDIIISCYIICYHVILSHVI